MVTPGGAIHPFCEPVITTSSARASVSSGRHPAPLTLSTQSSLPRPLMTAASAGRSLLTPVEVSLCVTNTVWMAGCSARSEEHTSELQSRFDLVCRLLLEKKKHFDDVLRI